MSKTDCRCRPQYCVSALLKELHVTISAKAKCAILRQQPKNNSGLELIALQLEVSIIKYTYFD